MNGFSTILIIAVVCAWLTHIVTCIIQAKYMLLLVGAFMFPVGIIHGFMIWLGVA